MKTYLKIALLSVICSVGAIHAASTYDQKMKQEMQKEMEQKKMMQQKQMQQKEDLDTIFVTYIQAIRDRPGSMTYEYVNAAQQAVEKLKELWIAGILEPDDYQAYIMQLKDIAEKGIKQGPYNAYLADAMGEITKVTQNAIIPQAPQYEEKPVVTKPDPSYEEKPVVTKPDPNIEPVRQGDSLASKYQNDSKINGLIHECSNMIGRDAPYDERLALAQNVIEKAKQQLHGEELLYFITVVSYLLRKHKKSDSNPNFKKDLYKPLKKILMELQLSYWTTKPAMPSAPVYA